YKNAINPMLNSSIAKGIPVLLNDSFGKLNDQEYHGTGGRNGESVPKQLIDRLKGNVRVIEYFNGVTIDDAIKSNCEIDAKARQLVQNAKTDRDKAYKIYKWISSNIKYDYDKARKLGNDPDGISSGSTIAFKTRKGICFDFSSLYVSMCRAVGLKVQLITGLGYSGVSWGDHAWNRVFISDENKWVNVDTTFGTIANYFDRKNFGVDHTNAEIQGEWPSD
ncbi:MAG TPA: transglutaminase domain-containing protein, partial [Clostridia bacterium]|nr:transglutaminase domain-containing protein [Clostridia bacterium]